MLESGCPWGSWNDLKNLPVSRQLTLLVSVLAVIGFMTFMFRGVMKPQMALLYSGLEPARAGEIIDELSRSGVRYELRGEAIFIPEKDRDAVRFSLAKEGLPRPSVQGYELLDSVNGFSVTSEMYNATYWRAKEGELTRTILAIPGVTAARVHIGASLRSGFSRSQPSNTASVTLSTSSRLSQQQAEGIQYLVALAVSGLPPEEVVVIDAEKGILTGSEAQPEMVSDVTSESRSNLLEQKILSMLEARVGAGNARVSVSMEVSRDRQRISAVTFDPESRVIRNRTTSETSETSQGSGSALTVASNLPDGEGQTSGGTSETENSSESISYDVSETRTETERLPGAIERISIAVLLDTSALGIDTTAAGATETTEQIVADFQNLVRSAAGLSDERGDALTIELMPFRPLPVEELQPAPSLVQQLLQRYLWSGIQAILLGLVVLVLGFGVVRPILKPGGASARNTDPATEGRGGEAGASSEYRRGSV